MAVYSTLLAAGRLTGAGDALVYTAPAVGTVVVRDIELDATAIDVGVVSVYVLSGSVASTIYSVPVVTARQSQHWDGRAVLLPGDAVYVYRDGGPVSYRVSGYLLGGA